MRGLWALRRTDAVIPGPKYEEETLEAVKDQAFGGLRGFAPCRIRVAGDAFEEWAIHDMDGVWCLNEYSFHRDGIAYACEYPSPGTSGRAPARRSSARWNITVDGKTLGAFSGKPDDGDDLAAFEDRVVEWWGENGEA